jgi:hypothetical protein
MEEKRLIPANEFCTQHQLEINFIYLLREYGLVEIVSEEGSDFLVGDKLEELERIIRLHYELQLNMEGIDVVLHLLEQLQASQKEVKDLKNQLRLYS